MDSQETGNSPSGGKQTADQVLRQLFISLRKDTTLTDDAVDKLRKLRSLVEEGLISQEEYEGKKKEWLSAL